jgi:hypothetical protein
LNQVLLQDEVYKKRGKVEINELKITDKPCKNYFQLQMEVWEVV